MQDYHTLCENFLQQKQALGYKYHTDKVIMKEIEKFLIERVVLVKTR